MIICAMDRSTRKQINVPLRNQNAVSFLATSNSSKSKIFFEKALGLNFVEETNFALVFSTGNGQLRIQKIQQLSASPYTSMGWQVDDIGKVVTELTQRGVIFDQHEGLEQDSRGIWNSPSGAQIAWFKDPDGNTLSLTQQERG